MRQDGRLPVVLDREGGPGSIWVPSARPHPAIQRARAPYGVCTVLVPALGTQLTLNGKQGAGKSRKREREKRPFSTSALAFSENWTSKR